MIEALAGGGRARARHHRRRLYARTAGAAHDLRPLSRRVHRAVAARHGPSAARRAYGRPVQHGRGGDHDVGLRARPRAHGRAAGLRRSAGEFLRLHRRRRLRHRRLRGAEAAVHPRRAVRAGPQRVDRIRDRAPARARRVRADELDHAAEAQPGTGGASAPDGVARRGALRSGADGRAQHAVHRHERFRGRSADRRLRGVRHGPPDAGAAGRIARGGQDRQRQGAPPYRRSRHHARRACRFAGAHGGDLVPPGARRGEQARAPHDRRRHDAVQGSVHRVRGDIRRGDRPARAPARGRFPALHDARSISSPCARCTADRPRHRSPPASGATAPRSRTSARRSTRSPRANATRKRMLAREVARRIAGA